MEKKTDWHSKVKYTPVNLPVYTFINTASTRINYGNLQILTLYKYTHFCGHLVSFGSKNNYRYIYINKKKSPHKINYAEITELETSK